MTQAELPAYHHNHHLIGGFLVIEDRVINLILCSTDDGNATSAPTDSAHVHYYDHTWRVRSRSSGEFKFISSLLSNISLDIRHHAMPYQQQFI